MTARDRLRGLWRSRILRVLAVRSAGVLALYGLEITLARRLGVAGYGVFAYLLVTATLVARFAPLGWQNAATRFVAAARAHDDLPLLKAGLARAYLSAAVGLVAAGLLLAALARTPLLAAAWLPAVGLPLAAALTLLELHRFILRGLDRSEAGEALPMLLLPMLVIAGLWLLPVREAATAAVLYAGAAGVALAVSAAVILHRLPKGWRAAAAAPAPRSWLWMSGAILIGSVSDEATARVAVLVLGAAGDEAGAGQYQAAARLVLMTVFVLRAATASFSPRIAALHHAGETARLRREYGRVCLASAAGGLPFLLLFGLAPHAALALFGPGFTAAAPLLQVLAVGYMASAAAGPCGTALMMTGRERAYAVNAVVGLACALGGSLALVPSHGSLGAAAATAGALVVVNLLNVTVLLVGGGRRAGRRLEVAR
ncbi:lipopolysaccharide biosynthesis protein [Caenispirillum bisanense]|uniref:Membrane protein involved in the export of O-antigen and teichoic acid n=1 Tax=Caenispirillum bisanense TaxID=414052 RepID=A0A286GD33_9PROT|nr:polysaccharide biosynthesis C-terminal domain-containing protein [Caenispirillum bisanense]SOD93422.1 Membrane protein involved in the export of O-antigen and teichoic acid [Caenispirillum bisanense]